MQYLQIIGLLVLGGTLGFAACAILQMSREREADVEDCDCEDTQRLDYLEGSNLNIAHTKLGDKAWWTVVDGENYKSLCVAHTVRDAIDGAKLRANETPNETSNG